MTFIPDPPRPMSPQRDGKKLARRSSDPLGDELLRRALAFTDEIVQEAGDVLKRGMRGELPGSDAREQRLCAQAIRAERVPSASSQPTSAPQVVVRIASFARIEGRNADGLRTVAVTDGGSSRPER